MHALVTGGAGFIGSALAELLLTRDAEVVVFDDLSSGHLENVPEGAKFVEGDVRNLDAVISAMAGCDVVFHQAAHRAVLRSVEQPIETNGANVDGTLNVLCAAREVGVRRVVLASSSSVYGPGAVLPTPEDAPLLPGSPYAVTKLTGEHYARVFHQLYGLETVALRYFNVYGPRQRPDSQYAAVIPAFIDALRHGRRPLIHGDGEQSRDFTYIADVALANVIAATAPAERCAGQAFNIAGGDPCTINELLQCLTELLDVTIDPLHSEPRAGDVRHSYAQTERAEAALGYRTATKLREGLSTTIEWFEG